MIVAVIEGIISLVLPVPEPNQRIIFIDTVCYNRKHFVSLYDRENNIFLDQYLQVHTTLKELEYALCITKQI
jgi:hypothetical protein